LHGGNEEYSTNIKIKAAQAKLEYERGVKTLGSQFPALDCSSVVTVLSVNYT
jgi:hypothetical protein